MGGGRCLVAVVALAFALAAPAAAADGVELTKPAPGATLPARGAVAFAWTTTWTDGVQALLLARDPSFAKLIAVQSWSCAPLCATTAILRGLPGGTYYWGIGVKLATGEVHLSEPRSFTVAAAPRAPKKPPRRKRPKRP
jgi:hypothetical protein